ncbi:MAG: transglycosylase family protein [Actinobacteria bacterium]|nr:transglycosylase family protein [Actinomycetota bacterium]
MSPHLPRRVVAVLAVVAVTVAAALLFLGRDTDDTPAAVPTQDPVAGPPALVRAAQAASVDELIDAPPTEPSGPVGVDGDPAADAKLQRIAVRPEPVARSRASSGSLWDRLAQCESSGRWSSTRGMFEGGLQFHPQTWERFKPSGYPDAAYNASRQQQIAVAKRVLARQGWEAWPVCSRQIGVR